MPSRADARRAAAYYPFQSLPQLATKAGSRTMVVPARAFDRQDALDAVSTAGELLASIRRKFSNLAHAP